MTLDTILIIILILILLGAIPAWPHSRGWGYGPSGIVGVILVILLILVLMGRDLTARIRMAGDSGASDRRRSERHDRIAGCPARNRRSRARLGHQEDQRPAAPQWR